MTRDRTVAPEIKVHRLEHLLQMSGGRNKVPLLMSMNCHLQVNSRRGTRDQVSLP